MDLIYSRFMCVFDIGMLKVRFNQLINRCLVLCMSLNCSNLA